MHILLVDDNELARVTAAEFLREEGFEVTEAESGRQAVELFDASRPDVVLLDIQMPDMNGVTVAETLHTRDASTPLIAVTGASYLIDEQRYLFSEVFRKPVSLAHLSRQITARFARH